MTSPRAEQLKARQKAVDQHIQTVVAEVRVRVIHKNRYGEILSITDGGDLIVDRGLDHLPRLVGTGGGIPFRLSAIGQSDGATAAAQTRLGTARYAGTFSYSKDSATGSASLDRVFAIGSTYTIQESSIQTGTGTFAARGTMYSRGTFAAKNVVAGDTLTLNYTIGFVSG